MRTMTFSLIAAFALGCASKPVEDLPTEELDENGDDGGSTSGGGDDDGGGDGDDDDVDADNDGVTIAEGDCNDDDDKIYPGAVEACNGIDDDCDEDIDEGIETTPYYEDLDEDGYGDPDVKKDACEQPEGYVENDEDCDDTEEDANPEGEEISFNDIDENCDGLDFGDGEECVDGALELTMDWMDYWSWPIPDTSGAVPVPLIPFDGEYTMTEKYLDIDPEESTATAVSGEPLKVNVEILTDITVQAHLVAEGPAGTFAQDCTIEIGPAPVLFSGVVELDLDGEIITGEADLDYNVLEFTDYDADPYEEGSSCNFSTIDTVLGYLGYSIDEFVADDLDRVADALRDQIENDLQEWDIPQACDPDTEVEESEICLDTCEFAGDDECDDGGEGSEFAICEYGTDCSDCGPR